MAPLPAMPITTPPYYAIPLCAGVTATMGGIAINEHCQALRADGSTISGLYAAGSTVAGLEGGAQMTYLGGLSKAFILGLLAAEAIAQGKTDEEIRSKIASKSELPDGRWRSMKHWIAEEVPTCRTPAMDKTWDMPSWPSSYKVP